MALDPNIALGIRPMELANPLAQYGQIAQIQNAQNQNALAQYQLSSAQRADEQQNNLYAAAKQPNFKLDFQSAIQYGAPGIAAFKAQQEAAGTALTQTKTQGEIDAQKVKAAMERVDAFSTALAPLVSNLQANKPVTHNDVFAQANRLVSQGLLRKEDLANIPMNALELPKFVMGMATSTENSRKALQAYLPEALVAGGNVINKNPLAAGGIGNVIAPVAMTGFETARVPILQQTANAASANANTSAGQLNVAQQREARLAQGPVSTSLTPEQNDALFGENGAVAMGKINPNKINSRNAKMWAEAFTRNPNADPVKVAQDVATADKAIKDFGTGPQSVKVTAFNTAIDHLDTLSKLGEAMQNNDVKVANLLANKLGAQAGQPMATMFNQASRIVGGEISKAIVPGVGTGRERAEAAEAFNSAMSPAQLKGADIVAKKLLGGQLASLEQQYRRTTKRDDFAEQLLSPAARAAYQLTRPTETVAPITTNPHANKTDAQIRKDLGLPP